jgi:catalase (peroxidase I)
MRFAPEGDHGANAGLKAARDFLEPVKGIYQSTESVCKLQIIKLIL